MKTLGITFAIIFGLVFIVWLLQCVTYKSKFNKGKIGMKYAWNEGANIQLYMFLGISVFASVLVSLVVLIFNFLENGH